MIKHSPKLISSLLLGTLCFSLGSCGAASNSGDSKTYSFLVEFYDDASENKEECNKVGYAYVAYGQPVTSVQPFEGQSRYDEKSKRKPSTGKRFKNGFSNIKWEGAYADIDVSLPAYDHDSKSEDNNAKLPPSSGDVVDPKFIKGNCALYANFIETPIEYRTRFYNVGSTIKGNDGKPFDYGNSYTLGNFVNDFPKNLKKDAKYGYQNDFKGFGFTDASPSPFGKDSADPSPKFSFGEGEPLGETTPGSFYEDTEAKDENGHYTLDLWGYDGTWTKLGSANSNKPVEISYYANFTDDYKRTYEIQVYDSYDDYLNQTNSVSIWGDYSSNISFSEDYKTVSSLTTHTDKLTSKKVSKENKNIRNWRGFYSDFVSYDGSFGHIGKEETKDEAVPELYAGKLLFNSSDENIVSAPMKIFPVFSDCQVKINGLTGTYDIAYGNAITFNGTKISFVDAEGKVTTDLDIGFGINDCEIKYQNNSLNKIVLPEECKDDNYSLLIEGKDSKLLSSSRPILGDIEINRKNK